MSLRTVSTSLSRLIRRSTSNESWSLWHRTLDQAPRSCRTTATSANNRSLVSPLGSLGVWTERWSVYCHTRFTAILLPVPASVVHSARFYPFRHSPLFQTRHFSSSPRSGNTPIARYIIAVVVTILGLSYAAVPLYRLYCRASGYGGTVTRVDPGAKVEQMKPVRERSITIRYFCREKYIILCACSGKESI